LTVAINLGRETPSSTIIAGGRAAASSKRKREAKQSQNWISLMRAEFLPTVATLLLFKAKPEKRKQIK